MTALPAITSASLALPSCPLSVLAVGASARVVTITLEPDEQRWLRAVGIVEGERVIVLRRALFGGPLHVRTETGGEFAIGRALAARIEVRRDGRGV